MKIESSILDRRYHDMVATAERLANGWQVRIRESAGEHKDGILIEHLHRIAGGEFFCTGTDNTDIRTAINDARHSAERAGLTMSIVEQVLLDLVDKVTVAPPA